MPRTMPLDEIKNMVGSEAGRSDWFSIDQDRVNRFADCTEDRQWIHVDQEKAANGPFGGTIAHGFLTLSLIPYFDREYGVVPEGASMTVNYGLNKVRLLNPVPVGSRIRDVMTITEVAEKGAGRVLITTTHTIGIEGQEKPACVAEALMMYMLE